MIAALIRGAYAKLQAAPPGKDAPIWIDVDGVRWLRAWPHEPGVAFMLAERAHYRPEAGADR